MSPQEQGSFLQGVFSWRKKKANSSGVPWRDTMLYNIHAPAPPLLLEGLQIISIIIALAADKRGMGREVWSFFSFQVYRFTGHQSSTLLHTGGMQPASDPLLCPSELKAAARQLPSYGTCPWSSGISLCCVLSTKQIIKGLSWYLTTKWMLTGIMPLIWDRGASCKLHLALMKIKSNINA